MKRTSWVAVLIVVALGSAVGVAAGSFLAWWLPMARSTGTGLSAFFQDPFQGREIERILMIGEDNSGRARRGGHGLSDTLVVLAINTRTKEVRAISVPRDTRVEIPGHGTCKINAANAYGGPELAKQVVQDLLGVEINNYVATTPKGLRGLVDLVGGVYVVVNKEMNYDDNHQDLHIHLKPVLVDGVPQKQLLNGQQAEGFVRFRHDRIGDSGFDYINGKKVPAGRTVRQQYFMRALANRILGMPSKRDRATVLSEAYDRKMIMSDLGMTDWNGLSDYFKDVKPESMVMTVLPGMPGPIHGASYWLPDYEQIRQVVAQNMYFQTAPEAAVAENAKIEVLNGSGITGAAIKVADRLKQAGFMITRTDNAPRFDYTRCCIINHGGKTEPVQRIAKLLNCDDIREETASAAGPDVTVIVGRDYND